ncbi:hypothetical protein ACHMW6_28890 [Pseudoduganella sp. UC29_106]|uniref:hypothetical protein n=1 Tax=Pseudoduganella sp. UC29_106 TaxID=3374553 RepID=UPI003757FEE1
MTLLINLIKRSAHKFNEDKYPSEVYYHLTDLISQASTCQEMGSALIQLIHWKAGHVRRDPAGKYVAAPSGTRYMVGSIRYSNTLTDAHIATLMSEQFFQWAKAIRSLERFDTIYIQQLHEMGLWTTVVMPVFILHCLRPRVFPICDIMVLYAHDLLTGDPDGTLPATFTEA